MWQAIHKQDTFRQPDTTSEVKKQYVRYGPGRIVRGELLCESLYAISLLEILTRMLALAQSRRADVVSKLPQTSSLPMRYAPQFLAVI